MKDFDKIQAVTAYLFGCDYNDPAFDDDSTEHEDAAEALVAEYGWNTVFPVWFDYLKGNCPTEADVINFANLFFYYGGADRPLRDPYPFVSYLYYRVDTTQYGGEATDIFDSIVIPMLSRIGDVSLDNQPDYVPENDPKVLNAIEKWKTPVNRTNREEPER